MPKLKECPLYEACCNVHGSCPKEFLPYLKQDYTTCDLYKRLKTEKLRKETKQNG